MQSEIVEKNIWEDFSEDGVYRIHTPNTPTSWKNVLFNDEYVLALSQRMTGSGCRVENCKQIGVFGENRSFYVKSETGIHRLFCGEGEYLAEYDLGLNTIAERFPEVAVEAKVFVPVTGMRECWRFTIQNTGKVSGCFDLFCHFPFVNNGPMGGECRIGENARFVYKYSFPYHVFYEDMEKVKGNYAYSYLVSNREITSFAGAAQAFFGGDNPYELPESVRKGSCPNIPGEGDDMAASLHFQVMLDAGEAEEIELILGSEVDLQTVRECAEDFPSFEESYGEVEKQWAKRCEAYHIETPYEKMNHLFNKWFLKQAVLHTRLNRSSAYCPVRNQLQDALGYSMVEPEEALQYALRVLRRQHYSGYLKQWYMVDGSPERDLCKIEHSDACIWLILCITEIINNTGDKSLFMKPEPYMDTDCEESILEHLKKAAKYMNSKLGAHGLCLFLDGDWTDPINGAGRKGKGESVWNSMALIFAIKQLTEIFPDEELTEIAARLEENINKYCWDGAWYIAGFDDEGIPFGTKDDEEGKLFLNTQTWALIAGIVPEENEKILVESIESLRVPFGYLLLSPAFSGWNSTWGRISIKQKGTTENGSVYCHASMFKALSDCIRGDVDSAFNTIQMTLPINPENPPEKNLQLPLYVPNYYFGLEGQNFGKSSCHSMTGTNAWLLWVMMEYVLGVKTTVDGICFEEHLPESLKGTKICRKYRDKIYRFEVE